MNNHQSLSPHNHSHCCNHSDSEAGKNGGHIHGHHLHGLTDNIRIAFFLNLSFTLIEIVGAYFTNSMAVLADAIHDLGDSFGLGLGWWLQHLSGRKSSETLTFGYRRLSLAGALVNSLLLFIGSLFVLSEAVPRLWDPPQAHAPGMMALAILGIAANGLAVLRLKQGKSLNERVLSLHLMEDVLGWVAVLIVSGIMLFVHAPILDPLLSILITLVILFRCIKNLREVALIFLEASPGTVDLPLLVNQLEQIPGVRSVHDVHLWSLDGDYNLFTMHAVVEPEKDAIQLKQTIREQLSGHGINHSTLEFEYGEEECDPCDLQD